VRVSKQFRDSAVTIKNDEHWLSLIDAFQSAAIGEQTWDSALHGLAEATGSRGSQLIGRKSDLSVLYNVMTDIDPELQKRVIELQPLNPRPPIVERAPLLHAMADWDVISPEESKRNLFYQEVLLPVDAPFFCATVIERRKDLFVTLGVMRSHADGYITSEQRQAFSLLAPHVRAAIRLQAALEGKTAAVLAECMEALSIPLFICDSSGRVNVLTKAAEALVSSARGLELKNGRLRAALAHETKALEEAIASAAPVIRIPGPPTARTVVIHGASRAQAAPIVLEIFPLPGRTGTPAFPSIAPQVLIVACGQRRSDGRRAAILGAVYHLTAAEIEITQLLVDGKSPRDISVYRGVSLGTVRFQIKAILGKLGLRRQVDLVAQLNQL
jgi:DNA-binding CsgD family transcriptional regulator